MAHAVQCDRCKTFEAVDFVQSPYPPTFRAIPSNDKPCVMFSPKCYSDFKDFMGQFASAVRQHWQVTAEQI